MTRVAVTFELRRDTAADWAAKNTILLQAEPGLETDTGLFKVGDGVTAWSSLPYLIPSTQRGAVNGVATLDGTGKVPSSQLPATAGAVTSVDGRTGVVVLSDLYDAAGAASTAGAAAVASSVQRASNLSDLVNATSARGNLGLGTAAVQASTAFDAAGAATAAQAASQAYADVIAASAYGPVALLPQYPRASTVQTRFQTGHGWTSNGTGATFNLNDTTDFDSGTQSAKMTTGGAGAQTNIRKFAGTVPDTTGKYFRLRIKVDDTTHLSELDFYLGSTNLGSNYKWTFFTLGASAYVVSGQWLTVVLSFADAVITGSPARSGMTDLQIQAWDDNTTNPVTVHIQSVELVPDGSTPFPNGVVSFCFDDSWDSPKTIGAWDKLDGLGWPASMFVITDVLGVASRLTLADLKNRHDRWGWEIASHAYTDAAHALTYTGETAAALETDRRAQKAWMITNGLRDADGSAYPLGQFGQTTDAQSTREVSRRYFAYERTTSSRTVETYPPADPLRLRATSAITTFAGGVTPASLTTASTGKIAKAAANAGWLILVFHKIVTTTPAATTECLLSDFQAIVDAVNAAGMRVKTIGDVLRFGGA